MVKHFPVFFHLQSPNSSSLLIAVMAFKVGDQVEVVGSDGVFKHAFYTANVRSVLADGFEVQYHTRMTDDGEQKAEIVAAKQIRPIPDVIKIATIYNL
ncbi:hypothetical protein LXL04_027662 [Taraxacum kok-saghyz]